VSQKQAPADIDGRQLSNEPEAQHARQPPRQTAVAPLALDAPTL